VRIVAVDGSWSQILGAGGQRLGWVHGSILR
jgi:hypothetical protein